MAYRTALLLSLAALGAAPVGAAGIDGPGDEVKHAVRVVNNYGDMVRVYAEDAAGHLHKLGRVANGQLVVFAISDDLNRDGFRIKIYPSQPVWSLHVDDFGVKTNPLNLQDGMDVTVWVERELTKTLVEMSRG